MNAAVPVVPVLRLILDAGHGLSNKTPHVFDSGAVSCYGVEAAIVASIVDGAAAAIDADDTLSLMAIMTPECDDACLAKHAARSHLSYKVDWVNHHYAPFDLLMSIHMNDAEDAKASGVEVYYSKRTPQHKADAEKILKAIADYLDLPARGAFPSNHSQHSSLAILDDTKPEAYLVEIGFVSNGKDVAVVKQCGAGAVVAGAKARRAK